MLLRRTLAGLAGVTLAASTLTGVAAAQTPAAPPSHVAPQAGEGRGAEQDRPGSAAELLRAAQGHGNGNGKGPGKPGAPGGQATAIEMPASYPHQPRLRVFPPNAADATERNGTISHADLAPRLQELMAASDRVSTQVVGQSTGGRDLYLVTVTAPERPAETAQQTRWRELIKTDPARAARDGALRAGYKTPIWISANIHGNEWEGTDAAVQLIEELATATDPATTGLLAGHRLYFSLSLNPDGRTDATRATALNLDANRDMITGTTPESRSFVATAQTLQPLYAADFHGYTSVLQVEPCGPPHGQNYEYDLFIPHGYAVARAVEEDVVAAQIPGNTYYDVSTGRVVDRVTGPETEHIKIPYRDTPSGWDDYPPVFTAQYAAFHGAVTSTVELPKGRTGTTTTPENAIINTAVAKQTMDSMVAYVAAHSDEMLANQIEMFRRGVAGGPKEQLTTANVAAVPGPDEWKPLWDVADDQDPVDLPRAYVIPVGAGQRSVSDAEVLVEHLQRHGVQMSTLTKDARVAGAAYPRGSYVVDMHQPLRGLANALLDLGTDISQKVPSMYDISAWSLAYTWGATVDKVGSTTDRWPFTATPLDAAPSDGGLPPGAHGKGRQLWLTFDVAGVRDYRALNALLDAGAPVWLLDDGRAVVGPEGKAAAQAAADEHDIAFTTASKADERAVAGTEPLSDLTIAYVGNQDDLLSLTELGFDDLVPVTAAGIQAGAGTGSTGLEGADVLWVGAALNLPAGSAGRAAVQRWVDAGGAIVGRGSSAFTVASTYGLVSGTAVTGTSAGNGIVDVDTPAGSLLANHAQDSAFVYPATWFTNLGEGTKVEQTYAADPLLAGHWRPSSSGANGPASAAGQASVVSGEAASGARAVVLGTSVVFRTHPKGGLSQAAQAIFWAAG
ncbi:peptidase M14 [Xylanimonas oleitrophica]|uniref:Peptidase M14 n=1 Tax=Xylanimonas oleitrophica TaxID=2607479 RepID=A0A2W5WKG4_9MICO|nr:M14 family zinc carboxypeptidase [Xylanimonas oleitrophica]PZR51747.1 peptidase M14 [Xylanimonas oleitrophica]